jgi:hypothetical protein
MYSEVGILAAYLPQPHGGVAALRAVRSVRGNDIALRRREVISAQPVAVGQDLMPRAVSRVEELDTAHAAVRGILRVVRDLRDSVVQVGSVVVLP